jgi:ribosomal protein S18 acetylase RimI-like enzyme
VRHVIASVYRPGMIEAAEAHDREAILTLIADQQADPARRITAVGVERAEVQAELDGFSPPWTSTAQILRSTDGSVVGACAIEWDEEVGRAWIVGPWVAVADEAWAAPARSLVDAVLALPPPTIARVDLAGEREHHGLATLAAELGWEASEANHILVIDGEVFAAWPVAPAGPSAVRPAAVADVGWIAPLHGAEFPGTYASADRLVADAVAGVRTTFVAEIDGRPVGYASGTVHEDGEGYLDYVAVDPAARRAGVGDSLLRAVVPQLLAASSKGQVALTVQDGRLGARALYERLGFRSDGVIVGYRTPA